MSLRQYQIELIEKAREAYRHGARAPCIVLPCGGGKSVIVADIAKSATEKNNHVLFIVHRKELVDQIKRTFDWWGVDMNRCQVMMVQTASRRIPKLTPPQLIITDENHHSKASTYRKIYDAFPDAKRIGVTATPVRLDGSGLGDVNDELVVGVSAKWLIKNHYLAPYDYYAPSIADLTGIKILHARVSSGKDTMLHSLAAQINYYQQMIENHPGWVFGGVFADEAITGTKDSRENFQKLLDKCRRKELDMVITKSISRFARNTITLLETVRELKLLGIDVYFEEQNIHSISNDGELMLTILASYAQEESKSASDNRKWQIRKDFEQGKIGSITILGYRRNADGFLEIESQEAEIVRMIFQDYISGMGGQTIAKKLNEMGILTRQGNPWTAPRIKEIIQNEKYVGNSLLQKYYRNNHIEKKKTRNNGELRQILVEEAHEPIIDRETFELAQQIVLERQEQYSHEGVTKRYKLTGLIKCGCCGKNYQRKVYSQGPVWLCGTYLRKGKKYCPESRQIREEILYKLLDGFSILTSLTWCRLSLQGERTSTTAAQDFSAAE